MSEIHWQPLHMLPGEETYEQENTNLYAHEQGKDVPEYIGIISDALILNPWDREIIQEGTFVFHPEYVHALAQQGMAADPSLLLGIDPLPLAKGS